MATRLALRPLIKSVLAGTLAAGSVAVFVAAAMLVPFVGSWSDAAYVSKVLAGVAAITFVFVSLGVLLIGVPITLALQHLRRESQASYVAAGTTLGCLLPFVLLFAGGSDSQGFWICLLGGAGGGVAAYIWWRTYRLGQLEGQE